MIKAKIGALYLKYIPNNQRLERIWKLAQVDFKKRYYNDKFGMVWALLNPISQMFTYYFVFTRIFNKNEENYILYLFGGIILWMAFTEASNRGSHLIKQKKYLVENIRFDWMDLYYSHILSVTLGLGFNFIAYGILSIVYQNPFGSHWYLFPIVMFTWALVSLSCGILLGLIRSVFDDAIHLWNILTKLGFWASGIFFSGAFLIEKYTWAAYANPFVGIILNARACLLVNNDFYPKLFVWNLCYSIVLYSISVYLFNKHSKTILEKL